MITILCAGSRGDFQPYIALAQQLKKLGQSVRIAGGKSVEDLIQSYEIDVYPLKADFSTLAIDPKLIESATTADNPLKMLLTFNKMKEYGVYTVNDYYSACEGSDLIIYHPGCTIGYFAAQKFGIPSVLASPFPMHKTKECLSVVLYGKTRSNALTRYISHALLQGMFWMASGRSVKSFWKKRFGAVPDNFGQPYERHRDQKHPAIVSCSNFVLKRPDDWHENVHQKGYWFVEEPSDYTPSAELAAFLAAGEKPLYIGFGTMSYFKADEKLAGLAVEAMIKSGMRAILCGMGKPANLPDNIIAIDIIPHSWLFDRVSAVCHHGGAGTTAAGFKAGVPSIIIPFSNDQFAWAQRSYELGVGAKPIPKKMLSTDKLVAAFNFALTDQVVSNSRALGQKIGTENGARDCAQIIVECLES